MSDEDKICRFKSLYESQKPMYEAWGKYVREYIVNCLDAIGCNNDSVIKIPINVRVKDTDSITAKAFFRLNKNYEDPINQITDKVGIRFVVMVEEQIDIIKKIIESSSEWVFSKDVDYEAAKEQTPELFGYQSVHYIVRNKKEIMWDNIIINEDTPCEIQIRTLEQHAYAELSHDYVYKSNKVIPTKIKRNLAKGMALNETTDELFSQVYRLMNEEEAMYKELMCCLMKYYSFENRTEKINREIYDNIDMLIHKYDITKEKLTALINENIFIIDNIKQRQHLYIFMQPTVLILYYLVKYHNNEFRRIWEDTSETLQFIYTDLGIADN